MADQLPNGLYKLSFETRSGAEYGAAYLQDGRLRGGDSGMAYLGTYRQEGHLIGAEMSITQHRPVPGAMPALGLQNVPVELNGLVDSGGVVRVQGTPSRAAWCGLRRGFADRGLQMLPLTVVMLAR